MDERERERERERESDYDTHAQDNWKAEDSIQ